MAQQKLSYEFPYSSFELETDLSFILLSEGKAILPVGSSPSRRLPRSRLTLLLIYRRTASSTSSQVGA